MEVTLSERIYARLEACGKAVGVNALAHDLREPRDKIAAIVSAMAKNGYLKRHDTKPYTYSYIKRPSRRCPRYSSEAERKAAPRKWYETWKAKRNRAVPNIVIPPSRSPEKPPQPVVVRETVEEALARGVKIQYPKPKPFKHIKVE